MQFIKILTLSAAWLGLCAAAWGQVTCELTPNQDTLSWFTKVTDINDPSAYYLMPKFNNGEASIDIDGRLDEPVWTQDTNHGEIDMSNCTYYSPGDLGLEGTAPSWTGPADLSVKWYFAYDNEAIYVGVDRVDDNFVNDQGTPYWERDFLEISLDPAASNVRKKLPGTEDCIPGGPTMNAALSLVKMLCPFNQPLVACFYTACEARGASLPGGPDGEDLGHVWWNWDVDGLANGDAKLAGTQLAMQDLSGDMTHLSFEFKFPFTLPYWPEVFADKGWVGGTAPNVGSFCKMNMVMADDDQVGVDDPAGEQRTDAGIRRYAAYWTTTGHQPWDDPFYFPKFQYGPEIPVALEKVSVNSVPRGLNARVAPNPFRPTTRITFTVGADLAGQPAQVNIYDVRGSLIRELTETAGGPVHTAVWDGTGSRGRPAASGIYLYRIKVGTTSREGQLVLSR